MRTIDLPELGDPRTLLDRFAGWLALVDEAAGNPPPQCPRCEWLAAGQPEQLEPDQRAAVQVHDHRTVPQLWVDALTVADEKSVHRPVPPFVGVPPGVLRRRGESLMGALWPLPWGNWYLPGDPWRTPYPRHTTWAETPVGVWVAALERADAARAAKQDAETNLDRRHAAGAAAEAARNADELAVEATQWWQQLRADWHQLQEQDRAVRLPTIPLPPRSNQWH